MITLVMWSQARDLWVRTPTPTPCTNVPKEKKEKTDSIEEQKKRMDHANLYNLNKET